MEEISYSRTTLINRRITIGDAENIIALFTTNPSREEMLWRSAGYEVVVNRFVKNLRCFFSISSIPEIELPNFDVLDSDFSRNIALRKLMWGSPRKQLELYVSSGFQWQSRGSISLQGRQDTPYTDADLMAYFSEGLAIELGDNGTIGIAAKNVGFGNIASNDNVVIYGSLIKEVKVLSVAQSQSSIISGENTNQPETCIPYQWNVTPEGIQLLPKNVKRIHAILNNNSDSTIWLGFGTAAIVGKGIPLNPHGGNLEIGKVFPFQGAIYAACEGVNPVILTGIECN